MCKNFQRGTILRKEKGDRKEKETNQTAISGIIYTI